MKFNTYTYQVCQSYASIVEYGYDDNIDEEETKDFQDFLNEIMLSHDNDGHFSITIDEGNYGKCEFSGLFCERMILNYNVKVSD